MNYITEVWVPRNYQKNKIKSEGGNLCLNDGMSRFPVLRVYSDSVEIYVLDYSTLSQLRFCTFPLLEN